MSDERRSDGVDRLVVLLVCTRPLPPPVHHLHHKADFDRQSRLEMARPASGQIGPTQDGQAHLGIDGKIDGNTLT